MNNGTDIEPTRSHPLLQGRIRTDAGTLHWDYATQTPVTLHGHLPFFAQFLSSGNLFSDWLADCPLAYSSNNAPKVADVMGTAVVSVLAGHSRYCHAAALFGDSVAAQMLGIGRFVSHDSLARALKKMDEARALDWLQGHLLLKIEPLLQHAYVLDIDSTVKPVYGSQEGAEIGYNPRKPGRPSYCYHAYMVGTARLFAGVDVLPGNQTAGCHSHPGLWRILDGLPRRFRPCFVRGDIAFGNEGTMAGCERRGIDFLFKLRQSPNVKRLIKSLDRPGTDWKDAGAGWRGTESTLRLEGWSRTRRVVVLRRPKQRDAAAPAELKQPGLQDEFGFVEESGAPEYEWAVLVTSLSCELRTLAQLYRDRGDCENMFDEMKNQWGWGGFTTHKMKPTKIMAGIIALVYNWWNIFCRLAEPEEHMEAITSRPMLQNLVGCLARSGGKRLIHLSMAGREAVKVGEILEETSTFLEGILTATQLKPEEKWARVLYRAFKKFLKGLQLPPTSDGGQLLLA